MVIVDPQGNVIPANIQPFQIKRDYTDPATSVDDIPGSATLNGKVCGFPNGTSLTYYYEYSTDCSLATAVTRTPVGTMTATGSCNQTAPSQNVTNLAPGNYCYR